MPVFKLLAHWVFVARPVGNSSSRSRGRSSSNSSSNSMSKNSSSSGSNRTRSMSRSRNKSRRKRGRRRSRILNSGRCMRRGRNRGRCRRRSTFSCFNSYYQPYLRCCPKTFKNNCFTSELAFLREAGICCTKEQKRKMSFS